MPQPRHATLATVALILGGIAIGTTEFVTMGLLPEIAAGVSVDIPAAGHTISAYAAGVVIGAPLLAVLGATWPRKALLIGLMAAFTVGNVLSALAPTYETLAAARFVAGLPHGAFFGVAALVAVDLAERGQAGRAVGRVMLGIPIANILGVPGATWLGQNLGWRSAYWLVAVIGIATVSLVAYAVPHLARDHTKTVRNELSALTSLQVWLTLGVGAVGFGGMFAMYSYIAPTITDVTGLSSSAVPVFLLVFGVSGFVGNLVAGRMGDWSVIRSVVIGMGGLGIGLALFALVAPYAVPAVVVLALISVLASVLVINLQLRLMQVAGPAQTLAAASNHAALNLANALGAWVGGVVIGAGYGYTAPSWVGVGLAALGLLILAASLLVHRRDHPDRVTFRPVGPPASPSRPPVRRRRARRPRRRPTRGACAPPDAPAP
ncbi:MFS transporter [Oryzobacter terrae]|uniref:MFS transporter n=1 Tax=Oryzobacter terrae TaxID=1620385 RepID=UPI00366EDE94